MKQVRQILLIIVAFTHSFYSSSQISWVAQNSGLSQNLYAIKFVDGNIGYAVGGDGKIIKTTDGGNNWNLQTSGAASYLMDSYFLNDQTGWICGVSGLVLKTTNGGLNWTPTTILGSTNFNSITFVSAYVGFVAGKNTSTNDAEIYTTTDAGDSWSPVSIPSGMTDILDIEFTDALNGYVLSYFNLYYTNNGGASWSPVSIPLAEQVSRIEMYDAQYGWVAGVNGNVFYTSDYGMNWNEQATSTTSAFWSISIIDLNNVFISGNDGTIISTSDGGANWINNTVPSTAQLSSISAVYNDIAWVCGDNGTILRIAPMSDLEIIAVSTQPTVCINADFQIEIQVANNGPNAITDANFVVLDGVTPVLMYNWSGNILTGTAQIINIGSMSISNSTTLTITFSGDSVTTNNTYYHEMSVYDNDPSGTNGPFNVCSGTNLTLSAYGGIGYDWEIPGNDTLWQEQTIVATENEVYYVKIVQANNCSVHDSVVVTIITDCNTNAFSPNDDGINDQFFIDGLSSPNNTVIIYNRWGDEIKRFQDYDNEDVMWNGFNESGEKVVAGSYFYTIEFQYETSFTGMVQVVR